MKVTKYLLTQALSKDTNLIMNTASGAVDIVDDETKNRLEDGQFPTNVDILNKLKERFYIVENPDEEENLMHTLVKYQDLMETKPEFSIANIVICPTYSCNLQCVYCFQDNKIHENKDVMSYAQIDAAFNAIEIYMEHYKDQLKDYNISLFGGEPLLRKNIKAVNYILELAKNKKKTVFITTNGTNVADYWDSFESFGHGISFQITLDGTAKIHNQRRIFANGQGTFSKIVTNIDQLLAKNFDVKVRVNLDEQNVEDLPNLLAYFQDSGWIESEKFQCTLAPVHNYNCITAENVISEYDIVDKLLQLFPDFREVRNKYHLRIGPDMLRNIHNLNNIIHSNTFTDKSYPSLFFCEATHLSNICIGPDNHIYACTETLGEKEYAIGKFYPTFEIDSEKFNQWKKRTIFDMEECRNCNIGTLCGGGCAFRALLANGRPNTPFCGNTRQNIARYINNHKNMLLDCMGG
jgi:uncharacterized protein